MTIEKGTRMNCYEIPGYALALHGSGFTRGPRPSRWRRLLAVLAGLYASLALQVVIDIGGGNTVIVTPSGPQCTVINGGGGVLIPICTK